MLKYIDDEVIANQTVLIRVDFNVPLDENGTVADDARIRYALPTIKYLLDNKNKLILITHLGKPKGVEQKYSVRPILIALQRFLPSYTITLVDDITPLTSPLSFADNEIKFLENIRFFPGEKENDPIFAKHLASLADVYVTDAFSVCHRNDASVAGIPQLLKSYGGFQLRKEITMLDRLTHNPNHPFVAILGGSKISTKLPLIHKLAQLTDTILVAGGMANTLLRAKGIAVGQSLIEQDELDHAAELLKQFETTLVLPIDAVVNTPNSSASIPAIKSVTAISENDTMYDIGPKTITIFIDHIAKARTILWNGPVGLFEEAAYRQGTDAISTAITANPAAFTVVGGGDTLRAIKNIKDKATIDHISTGGGAMLTYLAHGNLPGIEALQKTT